MPAPSATRSAAWQPPSHDRAGFSSLQSRSPTSTPPPLTCSPTSTRNSTLTASPSCSPNSNTLSERSSSATNSSAPSIQTTSSLPSTLQSTPSVKKQALAGHHPSSPEQRPGNSRQLRLPTEPVPAITLVL